MNDDSLSKALCRAFRRMDKEDIEKKTMQDLKSTVNEIGNCLDRIYELRPDLKPKPTCNEIDKEMCESFRPCEVCGKDFDPIDECEGLCSECNNNEAEQEAVIFRIKHL